MDEKLEKYLLDMSKECVVMNQPIFDTIKQVYLAGSEQMQLDCLSTIANLHVTCGENWRTKAMDSIAAIESRPVEK